jgi:hypothetical protein
MTGDLLDPRAVDDQLRLTNAYRQRLADVTPRHRIEVLLVADVAFHVDDPVGNGGDVIGRGGQCDQVGPFLCPPIKRPLPGLTMNTHIGDVGQPPRRHLVEMLQGAEGAAIEQVGLGIPERSLDLALGLTPPHPASLRCEAVVRGEGEELGVVQRPLVAVPQHHHLHVVVQTGGSDAPQVLKGANVFAQGGRQILRRDETQVLPTRVTQHVAEQVNAPPALVGEIDVVAAVIHLSLRPTGSLEALHRLAERSRP